MHSHTMRMSGGLHVCFALLSSCRLDSYSDCKAIHTNRVCGRLPTLTVITSSFYGPWLGRKLHPYFYQWV